MARRRLVHFARPQPGARVRALCAPDGRALRTAGNAWASHTRSVTCAKCRALLPAPSAPAGRDARLDRGGDWEFDELALREATGVVASAAGIDTGDET